MCKTQDINRMKKDTHTTLGHKGIREKTAGGLKWLQYRGKSLKQKDFWPPSTILVFYNYFY